MFENVPSEGEGSFAGPLTSSASDGDEPARSCRETPDTQNITRDLSVLSRQLRLLNWKHARKPGRERTEN